MNLRPAALAAALALLASAGCSTTSGTSERVPSSTPITPVSSTPATTPVSSAASTPAVPSKAPTRSPLAPAPIPPVSAIARAEGLLDVRTVVPDAVVDLRYATTDNFTHVQLYPREARCLVHDTMAPGLRVAAARLRALGDVLVFWDCYRPHAVQVRMFQVVPDPNWVARPGNYARSHESGRSVDVTVARLAVAACSSGVRGHGRCLLDMGTGFDDFTARAHAYATYGLSALEVSNRALLRSAMAAGGLSVYSGEWWHFDGPGALDPRPILGAGLD